MRLLEINSALNCGSTGRIAEQIGLVAQNAGWDVYIAHGLRYASDSALQSFPVSTPWDEKIHILKSVLFDGHGLDASKAATHCLVARIKELRPDIIHLHNLHGYYLNYSILFDYLNTTDIPLVWTLHDVWPVTGHCATIDNECNSLASGCLTCPRKRVYPTSLLLSRSARNYEAKKRAFGAAASHLTLVPVSNWLKCIMQDSFLGSCAIHVIHNGIDINVFRPREKAAITPLRDRYGLECKKVILGCAMQFSSSKGFNDFIEMRKLLPDDYAIVMIGLKPKQCKEVDAAGIIGIQRTQNVQELAAWYSLADVFANPTYHDSFSLTNIEALSCGTPVVTYRTGGTPETVDENTGIVVEQGDINALIQACTGLCPKSAGLSKACRERTVRLYNKDDRFGEYLRLYEQLLGNARR